MEKLATMEMPTVVLTATSAPAVDADPNNTMVPLVPPTLTVIPTVGVKDLTEDLDAVESKLDFKLLGIITRLPVRN